MIKNYLKVAWRDLVKNKVFSFINILGLTIGNTIFMMIFLFIKTIANPVKSLRTE